MIPGAAIRDGLDCGIRRHRAGPTRSASAPKGLFDPFPDAVVIAAGPVEVGFGTALDDDRFAMVAAEFPRFCQLVLTFIEG